MNRSNRKLGRTPNYDLDEFSRWVEWMKANLAPGGVDPPDEETCVVFAVASVHLAERVLKVSGHLPSSIRALLIQSAILHQCWGREVSLHKRRGSITLAPSLPTVDAVALLPRLGAGGHRISAADGHQYSVRFPSLHCEKALATEAICFALAKQIGLPVPSYCLARISQRLALRGGVMRAAGPATAVDFECLAVRWIDGNDSDTDIVARPSAKTAGYLAGATVLHVLTLGSSPPKLDQYTRNGRTHVALTSLGDCLMGADWIHYGEADYRQSVSFSPTAGGVRSYEQMEVWVSRIAKVNLQSLCEFAVKLPAAWYGREPASVVAIVEKIGNRITSLRHSLLHLIGTGYFPRLTKPPENLGTQ